MMPDTRAARLAQATDQDLFEELGRRGVDLAFQVGAAAVRSKYDVGVVLAKTTNSTTLEAQERGPLPDGRLPRTVAIKVVRMGMESNRDAAAAAWSEVALLRRLAHDRVGPPLVDAYVSPSCTWLVTEKPVGSLPEFVSSCFEYTEEHAWAITKQLLVGLEYLHGLNIVHRDVKPSNILVMRPAPLTVVLSGFGLAVCVAKDPGFDALADIHAKTCTALTAECGTPAYAAPEVGSSRVSSSLADDGEEDDYPPGYGPMADIFSAGVTLHGACVSCAPPRPALRASPTSPPNSQKRARVRAAAVPAAASGGALWTQAHERLRAALYGP